MTTMGNKSSRLCDLGNRTWLVTGGAGFIGSHLVHRLLLDGQRVIILDNFMTGCHANVNAVREHLSDEARARLRLIEGDIRDKKTCLAACENVDIVLHQAALGSVPRSIKEPDIYQDVNVNGFMNMLSAAREKGIKRFVYASSSSVYGDHEALPKRENLIGEPLSPYAASKRMNEIAASVFHRCYNMETVGLRYFNVFGPRQNPDGPYAAVIPKWLNAMFSKNHCHIYGDGETSRDFCFVQNAVEANLCAAVTVNGDAFGSVFNVAYGEQTTLLDLHQVLAGAVQEITGSNHPIADAVHLDFRDGDVRHSKADITRANRLLGYSAQYSVVDGIKQTVQSFLDDGTKKEQ